MNKREVVELSEVMTVPEEFYTHTEPKSDIGLLIHNEMEAQGLTIKAFAKSIGIRQHQILKVLSANENYKIDTLLKILAGLDMTLTANKK